MSGRPQQRLSERLAAAAPRKAKSALAAPDATLTQGGMLRAVEGAARWLSSRRAGQGDRVARGRGGADAGAQLAEAALAT